VLPRGSAYRDEALVNRYWSARRSPMASATSPPTLAGAGAVTNSGGVEEAS